MFQANPVTGDARISGTLASLAGLQSAFENGDPGAVDVALGRIFLVHAIIFGFGGIPLLYMGDELGLLNDHSYRGDSRLADDNRWTHRPRMPWAKAERRRDPTSIEGRVFDGLRHLAQVRATIPSLHASVESAPLDIGRRAYSRWRAGTRPAPWSGSTTSRTVGSGSGPAPSRRSVSSGLGIDFRRSRRSRTAGYYALPPYAAWWLTDPQDDAA